MRKEVDFVVDAKSHQGKSGFGEILSSAEGIHVKIFNFNRDFKEFGAVRRDQLKILNYVK